MPSVLFVCVANAFRSQMAEAIARRVGGGRWEVWSAGSHPSGLVHPLAIQVMAERGDDLRAHRSKGIDALPSREWDYVVMMGCGDQCPTVSARHRLDWAIPDPSGLSLEEIRRIRDRMERLIRELLDAARDHA